jgi:hypothetical protein
MTDELLRRTPIWPNHVRSGAVLAISLSAARNRVARPLGRRTLLYVAAGCGGIRNFLQGNWQGADSSAGGVVYRVSDGRGHPGGREIADTLGVDQTPVRGSNHPAR